MTEGASAIAACSNVSPRGCDGRPISTCWVACGGVGNGAGHDQHDQGGNEQTQRQHGRDRSTLRSPFGKRESWLQGPCRLKNTLVASIEPGPSAPPWPSPGTRSPMSMLAQRGRVVVADDRRGGQETDGDRTGSIAARTKTVLPAVPKAVAEVGHRGRMSYAAHPLLGAGRCSSAPPARETR